MSKLILGCGYLGYRVAKRWLAAGQTVFAVTRSPQRAEEFRQEGLQPVIADVTRAQTLRDLPEVKTVLYAVGYNPGSGVSRQEVYAAGLKNVLDRLPEGIQRVIFTSSTGVYGDAEGAWVDEDFPCRPTRDAGRAMLAAEETLRNHRLGSRGIVLRLGGLYGPGRLTRLADLLAGRPITVSAEGHLNLIHVDDAAQVVLAAESNARPPRTYIVSDGSPVGRRDFYVYLATQLDCPPPVFLAPPPDLDSESHSVADKRVVNRRMLEELQVQLTYPSYKQGLASIFKSPSRKAD